MPFRAETHHAFIMNDVITSLDSHHERLQALASEESASLSEPIRKIRQYYEHSLRTARPNQSDAIIREYETFVNDLERVKTGQITAEEAIKKVNLANKSRTIAIVFHNLAKVVELLFWALVASTCVTATIAVGLPLIITDVFIGLVVAISTFAMLIRSIKNIADCFEQFKSTDRHVAARDCKNELISFFTPTANIKPSTEQPEAPPMEEQQEAAIPTMYPTPA